MTLYFKEGDLPRIEWPGGFDWTGWTFRMRVGERVGTPPLIDKASDESSITLTPDDVAVLEAGRSYVYTAWTIAPDGTSHGQSGPFRIVEAL